MLNDYYFKHTARDGKRGLSFSRWAGWGDHRNPIHFSGDANTGWDMLGFEIPFTSASGNVGCFFWRTTSVASSAAATRNRTRAGASSACFPQRCARTPTARHPWTGGRGNIRRGPRSPCYKRGVAATTGLSYSRQGDAVTVRVAPTQGSYRGQLAARAYTMLLPGTRPGTLQAPANAEISYDAATGTNRIRIPEMPIGQELIVRVTVADLDFQQVHQQAVTRRLDGLLNKPYAQWTDADRAVPGLSSAVEAIQGMPDGVRE